MERNINEDKNQKYYVITYFDNFLVRLLKVKCSRRAGTKVKQQGSIFLKCTFI